MIAITERFTREAAGALRAAILDAGGNEVFCLGVVSQGRVVEVRVLARGNRHAAPAILHIPRPGEIVVHNHPSGHLHPSDADIRVASELGQNGVGSYIVDNEAREVYVVVEPHAEEAPRPVLPEEVERVLGPRGKIARNLSGYEHRPQQLAMARAVTEAFNTQSVLTVEAGTGTGKSLAYLVPAILWALRNKRRVIVATHTINLQEQLVQKDLPFLVERAGLSCSTALVKGRGNYLCRRKAAQIEEQSGSVLIEDDIARELREVLEWSRRTADGSLADLAVQPRSEVWEQVVSENDNCLRARCPFYSKCFFYSARRAAAAADVLVVNHHLLMADVALRDEIGSYTQNAVLPPAAHLVIDEAHHLEDVATTYFGQHVSPAMIERSLARLSSTRAAGRGLLHALAMKLGSIDRPDDRGVVDGALRWIDQRLLEQRRSLGNSAEQAFAMLLRELYALGPEAASGALDQKVRVTPELRVTPLWAACVRLFTELAGALQRLGADLLGLLERFDMLSDESRAELLYLETELRSVAGRLGAAAEALLAFIGDEDRQCRWIECRRRKDGPAVSFHTAPVEVNELLRRSLFDRFDTAILTSATLAVDGRFDFLHQRVGIDRLRIPERSRTLLVQSPFDYASQALLLVPHDLPDAARPGYEAATHEAIRGALEITLGGTFVLFTSYGALNRAFEALAPTAERLGLTMLKQGGVNRAALLGRFVREARSVLFGTDSFWEGVDVRGQALRCVIIPRLPFKVPTEPIEQARVEEIEARGGDAFHEHAVPQAVLKLKQGFGRLIRARDDRGCVMLLDSRVVHKRYGRIFLDSLPPARRVVAPLADTLEAMRAFFANGGR